MTNEELAKELSQYPLTAIATRLIDFERFIRHFNKVNEENSQTNASFIDSTKMNPLSLPDEERRKLFGERLKMMRKLHGFSRSDFAKQLKASNTLISSYENGQREPSIKKLIAMSQILNVETDWLLGISQKISENKTQMAE